ncbi:hypothetical protein HUG15_03970 [Salicibibacter cibarius]|uniref:Uncharacterized protein n=1 Tax=Salicibibacter cibarius TaxID=2743000 RepID=A0A7T6Z134_9BACI|nr:hypothetical protein HUG15_03970 [Salicibibacter cibarius]
MVDHRLAGFLCRKAFFKRCTSSYYHHNYSLISTIDFSEEPQKKLGKFYGDDIKNNDDYGRIINEKHFDRLKGILDADYDALVYGGDTRLSGSFYRSYDSRDFSSEAASMQEKVFGPNAGSKDMKNNGVVLVCRDLWDIFQYVVYTKGNTLESF